MSIRNPSLADRRYPAILAILEAKRCPAMPSVGDLGRHITADRSDEEIADAWMADPLCKALSHAYASIQRQAKRTVGFFIKCRVREYRRRPMMLEVLSPHLSCANGVRLIAWGEHLLERERLMPQRWFGFGGEVRSINARAVILLGRFYRRFEDRLRRVA